MIEVPYAGSVYKLVREDESWKVYLGEVNVMDLLRREIILDILTKACGMVYGGNDEAK